MEGWMARVLTRSAAVAGLAALCLSNPASVSAATVNLGQLAGPRPHATHSPDPGQQNFLSSVQTLTARDAWAVGDYCKARCETTGALHTLVLHWNGTRWVRVPSPSPGTDDTLGSVSGSSPADVWAVGQTVPRRGFPGPLVLRWNGRKWVRAGFTKFGTTVDVDLNAVSARSARDAWIVGFTNDPFTGVTKSLAVHWNGRAWRAVPVPRPGNPSLLNDVSVVSGKDAWAVGSYCAAHCRGTRSVSHGMIVRWNGSKWSAMRVPVKTTDILDIAALSATDAWATGELQTGHSFVTVILHWNGKRWSSVRSVAAVMPQELAFGAKDDGWGAANDVSIRWNGIGWRKVTIPGPLTSTFVGASAAGPSDVWVVGFYCPPDRCGGPSAVIDTVTMHWNGRSWTRK
jgi:hypothetical protein